MKLPKLKNRHLLLIFLALAIGILCALMLRPKKQLPKPIITPPSDIKQQINEQKQDDYYFGQTLKKVYQNYPWYHKLPITTSEYTIVYDFEKQAFRIRFTSAALNKTAISTLKQHALNQLENLDIDLKQYHYFFIDQNNKIIP